MQTHELRVVRVDGISTSFCQFKCQINWGPGWKNSKLPCRDDFYFILKVHLKISPNVGIPFLAKLSPFFKMYPYNFSSGSGDRFKLGARSASAPRVSAWI